MKKKNPLQSNSEILLRNIVVGVMVIFFMVFLVIPLAIALVGSLHRWNPLNGNYKYLGGENYSRVFQNALFWKSLLRTFEFSAVVIFFRLAIGLALAYAIFSKLIKRKNFYRTLYFIPVVTPLIAISFVWKFMYNPQFG
ncbi:MAG: sugar ABC transporter permease, partial [Sphaerochaetaceae bacterium]|nr:sugar ABC transporter permease [Sphaerochaetaceae bacterium]